MRRPGFEPGPSAWKAEILTTILPALSITSKKLFNKVYYSLLAFARFAFASAFTFFAAIFSTLFALHFLNMPPTGLEPATPSLGGTCSNPN